MEGRCDAPGSPCLSRVDVATIKKELIHRRSWPTKAELRLEVFGCIEIFYNRQRRHCTSASSPQPTTRRAL